ncbi:MAG: hypothetical protein Kow0013_16570 [Pararhodobacter sp.]
MDVSRAFLVIGALYLVAGIALGMYMGASQDRSLASLHAHVNLVGFVLGVVFALVYRVFPEMGATALARLHFWLHQVGGLLLTICLYLLLSQTVAEGTIGPVMAVFEAVVWIGVLVFTWNALRRA